MKLVAKVDRTITIDDKWLVDIFSRRLAEHYDNPRRRHQDIKDDIKLHPNGGTISKRKEFDLAVADAIKVGMKAREWPGSARVSPGKVAVRRFCDVLGIELSIEKE